MFYCRLGVGSLQMLRTLPLFTCQHSALPRQGQWEERYPDVYQLLVLMLGSSHGYHLFFFEEGRVCVRHLHLRGAESYLNQGKILRHLFLCVAGFHK